MNRTKIEWTDYTWNPVTGCWGPGGTAEKPKRCSYCYAEKVARRFYHGYPPGDQFAPLFLAHRLSEPARVKKPAKIFVCSMADLFGDWVPGIWIHQIIDVAKNCPQHTFQFLTKNPKRLREFPWPENCWVGTTVTNQADADERIPWLLRVDAPVRFVSHEPLLGEIVLRSLNHDYLRNPRQLHMVPAWENRDGNFRHTHGIDWAIIGAMTGPGAVRPDTAWVRGLSRQYMGARTPVFMKDNLKPILRVESLLQEWPK
jgi:protein gp37